MTLDYVSTMYLGENKDGYAQRKCEEKFLGLMGRMGYFSPENVKKRQIIDVSTG